VIDIVEIRTHIHEDVFNGRRTLGNRSVNDRRKMVEDKLIAICATVDGLLRPLEKYRDPAQNVKRYFLLKTIYIQNEVVSAIRIIVKVDVTCKLIA
jgi:hypothetical protein